MCDDDPDASSPTEDAGTASEPTPEEFEQDPAREPEDRTLKDVKGG